MTGLETSINYGSKEYGFDFYKKIKRLSGKIEHLRDTQCNTGAFELGAPTSHRSITRAIETIDLNPERFSKFDQLTSLCNGLEANMNLNDLISDLKAREDALSRTRRLTDPNLVSIWRMANQVLDGAYLDQEISPYGSLGIFFEADYEAIFGFSTEELIDWISQ